MSTSEIYLMLGLTFLLFSNIIYAASPNINSARGKIFGALARSSATTGALCFAYVLLRYDGYQHVLLATASALIILMHPVRIWLRSSLIEVFVVPTSAAAAFLGWFMIGLTPAISLLWSLPLSFLLVAVFAVAVRYVKSQFDACRRNVYANGLS